MWVCPEVWPREFQVVSPKREPWTSVPDPHLCAYPCQCPCPGLGHGLGLPAQCTLVQMLLQQQQQLLLLVPLLRLF